MAATKEIKLTTLNIHVKGRMAMEKIRCMTWNVMNVAIQWNAVQYHDTDSIYEVYVTGRVNAARLKEIRAFVSGCKETMVAFGVAESCSC